MPITVYTINTKQILAVVWGKSVIVEYDQTSFLTVLLEQINLSRGHNTKMLAALKGKPEACHH